MMLTEVEKTFLDRRRRLVRSWPYLGFTMLGGLAIFVVWLVLSKPLLANPFFVLSALEQGAIAQSTLLLMAGMLPVAIMAVLTVCVVTVLFAFAAFSNERKYLALLDKAGSNKE